MNGYLITAKDEAKLLVAFMREFAGNARITFEGDLSKCDFSAFPHAKKEPDGAFQRNTIAPPQDYVVLPLSQETIEAILTEVLPDNRCIDDVIHIQIEKNGELVMSACDNFSPDCTWASLPSETLLLNLKRNGVIESYRKWPEEKDVQPSPAGDAETSAPEE